MIRSIALRRAGIALSILMIGTLSGTAWAYLTTVGTGTGLAGAGALSAATISATPGAGTVALSWSAVTPPGSGTVLYYVTREGGAPAGNCPVSAAPSTQLGCTDSGVPTGKYSYRVVAVWRSWTATSSPASAQVILGPGSHFVVSAATTTPTAGAADNLTITAKDETNTTITAYTGSHSLTFSGAANSPNGTAPTVTDSSGAAINFGTATPITFSAGVASVSGSANGVMRLYNAGAATITASDGTIDNGAGLVITVSPATAASLALSAAATTPTAGAADNLTITAKDAYGNTATAYTGSHSLTFSGAANSPNGTAPTVADSSGAAINFGTATPITFSAGVASVSGSANGVMRLYNAGAATITASDGTIDNGAGLAITVSPAAPEALAFANVAISAGSASLPCLFTCTVTGLGNSGTFIANVSVTDSFGNTVTNLGNGSTVEVISTGGTVIGSPLTIAASGPATSTTAFTYTAKQHGKYSDTITASSQTGTPYVSASASVSR